MYPWIDYGGRFSWLRLCIFVSLFIPGAWIALAYDLDRLGAQPILEAERQIGLWTIRLLFASLAITPFRAILRWPRLIEVRRMIGVGVFAYAAAHFMLYIVDQAFDLAKVVSEIVLRFYLTIGFIGVLGASVLAATSTDSAVRRLGGRRWRRLHQTIYLIATLAVVHFFIQSKLEVWEPTIMVGLFIWLMGYRILAWAIPRREGLLVWKTGLLSLAAAILTAVGEAAYFWVSKNVSPLRVLEFNFSLATGIRPACVVMFLGLAVVAAGAVRDTIIQKHH